MSTSSNCSASVMPWCAILPSTAAWIAGAGVPKKDTKVPEAFELVRLGRKEPRLAHRTLPSFGIETGALALSHLLGRLARLYVACLYGAVVNAVSFSLLFSVLIFPAPGRPEREASSKSNIFAVLGPPEYGKLGVSRQNCKITRASQASLFDEALSEDVCELPISFNVMLPSRWRTEPLVCVN